MEDYGDIPKGALDDRMLRFWQWNGDGNPPQFSHWTSRGTVLVRAKTPGVASEVFFNGVFLGYDDCNPYWPIKNLMLGKYDSTAGFPVSEILPETIEEWNDLG